MPIVPASGDESMGVNVIPDIYANKNAGVTVSTRFTKLFAAFHISTAGVIVAAADANGATSLTLDVAAAGTLICLGTRASGTGAAATVVLT